MDRGTERMRYFTKRELKEFDGKDGRPAYIAFQGKIYDVSNSKLWKNGIHSGRHAAGEELTQVMLNAPHGEEVLTKFPLVGQLSQQTFEERIVRRIENFHFHPILIHFSIAYSIGCSLFSSLYFFTGEGSFETASFYLLFLAFLSAPPAGLSGLFSWKVTYEGRMSKTYIQKIVYTIILTTVVTLCFAWRVNDPNILVSKTYLSYLYLGMMVSQTPIVIILGYLGGKITFR
ncbi:MAG: hypothetical protein OEW45_06385 [Deltaproteobacteria bacterium]|nr:hypothetical protein [Deltaproteobacteria bacterium]